MKHSLEICHCGQNSEWIADGEKKERKCMKVKWRENIV